VPAPGDMIFPNNFYSTTNNPTQVFYDGEWIEVEGTMMDKVIVINAITKRAYCKSIRDVKKGDLIVVGEAGCVLDLLKGLEKARASSSS